MVILKILILLNLSIHCVRTQKGLVINVDAKNLKPLPRFWTNTGFCPIGKNISEALLSTDTLLNIELLGTLPNYGLKTIRIHWLLDLIKHDEVDEDRKFQHLDKVIHTVVKSGMSLVLEFMTHYPNVAWREIGNELLTRYSRKYGVQEIEQWKLESWNEPDLKSYNVLNLTLNGEFFIKLKYNIET